MKTPATVLLVSIALLAGTAVYLWRELADTRGKLDESAELTRRLNARVGELEKLRGFPGLAHQPTQSATSASAAAAANTSSDSASGAVNMRDVAMSLPSVQVESPAMQRKMRNQQRASIRHNYRDLVAQLGLNNEAANRLYDLLSEKQHLGFRAVSGDGVDTSDETDPATYLQRSEELRRKKDQEISALIGNSGLQELKEYDQSMGVRFEVDRMREELNTADLPMSDAQHKQLIKAALEEQQQYSNPAFTADMSDEEQRKLSLTWQREHTERMLAQAKKVLTPDQYQIYEDEQQSELDMQEQSAMHPGAQIVFKGEGDNATSFVTFTTTNAPATPSRSQPAPKKP